MRPVSRRFSSILAVSSDGWFDEIDLDPHAAWLRMGTRNLGDRPWLIVDERRDVELALKRELLRDRHDEFFAASYDADPASTETLDLVLAELEAMGFGPPETEPPRSAAQSEGDLHPLDKAGRLVQEDLCLLRPSDGATWILAAASLCFPSRWRLADKIARPLDAVHGPVEGYAEALSDRVDSLLNRLGSSIVWRRNWYVHPDGSLSQPGLPPGGDPVIVGERCFDDLHLRSERQTLRRLTKSGWVLFTIRVQQRPLGRFLADDGRRRNFHRFVTEADPGLAAHRGMSPAQIVELDALLTDR